MRWLFAAAVIATASASAAATPVVQPPFSDYYTLVDLGGIAGLQAPYGGLTFASGITNAVMIGGAAGAETAFIAEAGLVRDSTHTISGFTGSPSVVATAYAGEGGLAYTPDGVLLYSRVTWEVGEVKPDSSITDKVVNVKDVVFYRPGGLGLVPAGFIGNGNTLKLTTWAYGDWWTFIIAPDDTGTYDIYGGTRGPSLPNNPMGFAYVSAGTPGFTNVGLIVCEYANQYGAGAISAYDVDDHGDPIPSTRRVIVSGLDVPESITIDPVTGDFLFDSYQGKMFVLRKAPIPTTTTTVTTTSTTSSSTTTTSTRVPTTTTTSSTTRPTSTSTTSTTRPTTTSTTSTTMHSTTSTTTAAPTTTTSSSLPPTTTSTRAPTTTTSSTIHPTTTSTTLRPTTTSTTSTTTTTSPTTTTIPSLCGVDPSFEWIGCRLAALLALVDGASDFGPLQSSFVARVERAQSTLADGVEACAAGRRAEARDALGRLERQMMLFRARTRTLRARKTIPRPLAQEIGDAARDIAADADALQGSLACS